LVVRSGFNVCNMSNSNCNPNTIKSFVEKNREPAEQVPLDYFHISRTSSKSSIDVDVHSRSLKSILTEKKKKFPDDERWHTLQFREFANNSLHSGWNYLGVDCMGEVTVNQGNFKPRWSREYMRRSMARIYKFAEACSVVSGASVDDTMHVGVPSAQFITLTVQHAVTGSYRSMKKTVENLRSAWEGVTRWVNRRGWHYLRVMEPGEENHYPHFHMVVVGATDEDVEEFKKKWVKSCERRNIRVSSKAQNSERVDDIHNVGAYITKYMSKSFGEDNDSPDNEWWWKWMELCYREHIRVYAMDEITSKYIRKCYGNVKVSGIGCTDFIFPDSKLPDFDGAGDRALANPNEKAEDSQARSTLLTLRGDENPTCLGSQSARILIGGLGACPPDIRRGDTLT